MANEAKVPPKLNGTLIKNAIRRLGCSNGSTIADIQKYLEKKLECDIRSLKFHLKTEVERGNLSLKDGKYKVNETARRRRRSSGGSAKKLRKRRSGSRKRSSRRSGSRRKSSASRRKKRSGSKRRRRRSSKAVEGDSKKKKKKQQKRNKKKEEEQEEEYDSDDSEGSIAYGGEVCRNPSRGTIDTLDPCAMKGDLELPPMFTWM